jgi:hypothetical protein
LSSQIGQLAGILVAVHILQGNEIWSGLPYNLGYTLKIGSTVPSAAAVDMICHDPNRFHRQHLG